MLAVRRKWAYAGRKKRPAPSISIFRELYLSKKEIIVKADVWR